jgi:hypothetical protein
MMLRRLSETEVSKVIRGEGIERAAEGEGA